MISVTLTWLPPSCRAMLPQTFSAATTRMVAEPPGPAEPVVPLAVLHPANARAAASMTVASTVRVPNLVRTPDSFERGPPTVKSFGNSAARQDRTRRRPGRRLDHFRLDGGPNGFSLMKSDFIIVVN